MHAVQTICGLPTLLCQMRRPDERVCVCVLAGARSLSIHPFLTVSLLLSVSPPSVRPFGSAPNRSPYCFFEQVAARIVERLKPKAIGAACCITALSLDRTVFAHRRTRAPARICATSQECAFHRGADELHTRGFSLASAQERHPFSSRELPQGSRVH